jgi:hypothetical protein
MTNPLTLSPYLPDGDVRAVQVGCGRTVLAVEHFVAKISDLGH